jgi:hypothetical protein
MRKVCCERRCCALGSDPCEDSRVFDLLPRGERHSFLKAKIDADSLILAARPDRDLANKVAVPTATRIVGEVAGLDAAADLAVLPNPYLAAVDTASGTMTAALSGSSDTASVAYHGTPLRTIHVSLSRR